MLLIDASTSDVSILKETHVLLLRQCLGRPAPIQIRRSLKEVFLERSVCHLTLFLLDFIIEIRYTTFDKYNIIHKHICVN